MENFVTENFYLDFLIEASVIIYYSFSKWGNDEMEIHSESFHEVFENFMEIFNSSVSKILSRRILTKFCYQRVWAIYFFPRSAETKFFSEIKCNIRLVCNNFHRIYSGQISVWKFFMKFSCRKYGLNWSFFKKGKILQGKVQFISKNFPKFFYQWEVGFIFIFLYFRRNFFTKNFRNKKLVRFNFFLRNWPNFVFSKFFI